MLNLNKEELINGIFSTAGGMHTEDHSFTETDRKSLETLSVEDLNVLYKALQKIASGDFRINKGEHNG